VSRRERSADYALVDGSFVVGQERLRYADCRLRGGHNASNALAAIAMCCELGVPPRTVLGVLRAFEPLPHRFEHLGRHDEVLLVDDSKATTVHAVGAALGGLDGPVVLIVGGRDKGLPFEELRRYEERLRWTVCYGEAGERIARELGFERSELQGPFAAAVEAAVARTRSGDTLLLSPGCTSWDQFPSYEVRGHAFRELAASLLDARSRGRTR
jgi:UDP-N-acetylmuramoylalanine--D-glutamate ligase